MPRKRRVYDEEGHAQFITFSCYKRRKLLGPDRAKRIVIGQLGSCLAKHRGMCLGFVVMPNHVHVLVWFDAPNQVSPFMDKWKEQTSKSIKDLFRREHPAYLARIDPDDPVWQTRYYPFNVYSQRKLRQKLDYMHLNPVRGGLVEDPCQWRWSSARWYLEGKSVGIPIRIPQL